MWSSPALQSRVNERENQGHTGPFLNLDSFSPRNRGGGAWREVRGPERPRGGSQEWAGWQRAGRRASVLPGAQAGYADSLFSIWK